MRKKLILLWVLLLVAMIVYHYSRGQVNLLHERVADMITGGALAEHLKQWPAADKAYQKALTALPDDAEHAQARMQLMIASARVRAHDGKITDAANLLARLLKQASGNKNIEPEITRDIRAELAGIHYYAAWLMRLEGAAPKNWRDETARARQQFRFLADQGQGESALCQQNLEAAIRLERMSLSELRGRPLPDDAPQGGGMMMVSESYEESKQQASKRDQSQKMPAKGVGDVRDQSDNTGAGAGSGTPTRKGS